MCVNIIVEVNILDLSDNDPVTTPTYNDIDLISLISIGAASNNAEDRLHSNNTWFSIFPYLITIRVTRSKGNGKYKFVF